MATETVTATDVSKSNHAQSQPHPQRRIAVLISGSGTNLQALVDACNTPRLPHTSITLVLSNRKTAHGLIRAASASPPIPTAYLGLQPFLRANKDTGATREDYDVALAREVVKTGPDLVVLAGWMHIVSEGFLEVMRDGAAVAAPRQEQMQEQEQEQEQEPILSSTGGEDQPRAVTANVERKHDEDDANHQVHPTSRPIPVINLHPALPGQFDGANAIQRGFDAFQRGEVDKLGVMVHHVVAEVDRGKPVLVREVKVHKDEPLEAYEARVHQTEWEVIVEATRMVLDEVRPVVGDPSR